MISPPQNGGNKWRLALLCVALVIAFAAGSWFTGRTNVANSPTLITPSSSFEAPVVVQISGQVKNPGVYQLAFNARVYQAIEKAGGLLPDAETDGINLADWVEDGSQIIVPSKTVAPKESSSDAPAVETIPLEIDDVNTTDTSVRESTLGKAPAAKAPKTSTPKAHKSTSKELPKTSIDLNRATSEELQKLPGVGPAMAERILQYRKENQGFATVDDLDNVRGIGEKKLAKLRPFVVVKPLPFQKPTN